jgi:hypothetical protein
MMPDEIYEREKIGTGFVFSSGVGLELIGLMRASGLQDEVWETIDASSLAARSYCLNPNNRCVARYEALRGDG